MQTSQPQVAAIQLISGTNVNANLLATEKMLEQVAQQGATLAVLPENFAFIGAQCQDAAVICETPGEGPLQTFLSRLAARLGIWIVGGTIPLKTTNTTKWRSSSLVYDATGHQVGRYDKQHLFDVNLPDTDQSFNESDSIEPGNQTCVIETPIGKLGIAICYDLRFPELFRDLINQSAEIIAVPAAFTTVTGQAHWEILVRARAIENLAYIIAAGQGGYHVQGNETHGHSMIVDPWGSILDQRERGNGYAMAPINHEFQQHTRRNFPCLAHRRTA
jgi:nitrilase